MLRYSHGETVANRELDKIFGEGTIKDKRKRNKRAKEAVERYGYTQKEVADFIGVHYSVAGRLLR
ncbi:MAG: hypothetical protein HY761_07160 [Candidatus Omnitrophica bacterium]|nr:hypothetical protein [Candidatus Omnitrophota bacterium]